MSEGKWNRKIRNNKFEIALGIFFVSFIFYLLYWLVINPYDYPRGRSAILLGIVFLLVWSIFSFLQLGAALIRRKHLRLAEKIEVTLESKNSILIKGEFEEELVTHENLKYLDLFYSWNSNLISSDLEYAKCELTSGKQFLIPGYVIELDILKRTFKKKVRTVKKRFMNRFR